MSGRYNKAPLVYVSARINTIPLPQLLADEMWSCVKRGK